MLASLVVLAAVQVEWASAQALPDPDYWKQTTERRQAVDGLIYRESPQAVPSTYDNVIDITERLRQRQAALPPTNTQATSLWQKVRGITVKAALSTAPRALGTIVLSKETFDFGWKIGSDANAKYLHIGVPEASDAGQNYRWDKFRWTPANSLEYSGARFPAVDGWVIWMKQTCCWYFDVERWFNAPCAFSGFVPPPPFEIRGPVASTTTCGIPNPPGYTNLSVYYGFSLENGLKATGPIEDYTNQPYTRSSPAPTPPPQTTVEQSIETELEKPENNPLRQWLNYELASPGETDPLGIGPPNASQEVLDRTAQLLDSPDTQEEKASGEETIRNCRVPLWHYTSEANAGNIYGTRTIVASGAVGAYPSGALTTTITPLDPSWTEASLADHLWGGPRDMSALGIAVLR